MVANDIAFDIGSIGRLLLPAHLAKIAMMIGIMVICVGHDHCMMIADSMVVRP
jgi:hypothetical protein